MDELEEDLSARREEEITARMDAMAELEGSISVQRDSVDALQEDPQLLEIVTESMNITARMDMALWESAVEAVNMQDTDSSGGSPESLRSPIPTADDVIINTSQAPRDPC